ncbi:MAG: DUF4157 domain-containing protein [Flavobacteriales bacterium]|nr:DUF4157 domain-containing protein [Flavobacteriales bacterium]
MKSSNEKTKESENQAIANDTAQLKKSNRSAPKTLDNRPQAAAQQKLQDLVKDSPRANQTAQLKAMVENSTVDGQSIIQKKENNTGLPDNLKSGMENLTGQSLDDVQVHRNSDQPAQLNAHAYAQGTDIHLGPGQEKHLPHELAHVVQQKEGRVQPTKQLKDKVAINDNAALEKEADDLGAQATKGGNDSTAQLKSKSGISDAPIQRKWVEDGGVQMWDVMDGGVAWFAKGPEEMWYNIPDESLVAPDKLDDYKAHAGETKTYDQWQALQITIEQPSTFEKAVDAVADPIDDANTVAGAVVDVSGGVNFNALKDVKDNGAAATAKNAKIDGQHQFMDKAGSALAVVGGTISTYKAWKEADNPGEQASAVAETTKTVASAIETAGKLGVKAIGGSDALMDNILPGIGSGLGAFQNVMKGVALNSSRKSVKQLEEEGDKSKRVELAAYLKRVSMKLGLEALDFLFHATEAITAFAGLAPIFAGVKAIHSVVNLFKAGAGKYHEYVANKAEQADSRVTAGGSEDADVDREKYKALSAQLDASGDSFDPNKASAREIVMLAEKYQNARDAIGKLPDSASGEEIAAAQKLSAQSKTMLNRRILYYNNRFWPKPSLTEDNAMDLMKIHKNVVASILNQAQQEKKALSRYRKMFPEQKDKALEEYYKGQNIPENPVSPEDIDLTKIEAMQNADYFWGKTMKQIKLVGKRTFFSDSQIMTNLEKRIAGNKDIYLPTLIKQDSKLFTDTMDDKTYKACVATYVKKISF